MTSARPVPVLRRLLLPLALLPFVLPACTRSSSPSPAQDAALDTGLGDVAADRSGDTGDAGGSGGASGSGGTGSGGSGGAGGAPGSEGAKGTGGARGSGGAPGSGGRPGSGGAPGQPAFIIGADISWVQADEDRGVRYRDGGVQKDILQILKSHGFNYVRLRTFVNPKAPGGYSTQGYCDLAHTIAMAKRVKTAGLGSLLDFHYSDNWADPGKQVKPAAWASLAFADLSKAVHDYTKDAITQLVGAGARPDMVQVGNEITPGMLLPDGSSNDFTSLATLLKAGISGVKEVDPAIKIMLHIDRCDELSTSTWWLDGVRGKGVAFDVFGQSCYDLPDYQQPVSSWKPTFDSLAARYVDLQFVVAEYSQQKQLVNQLMFDVPGKRGLGTFIWEPTRWGERIFDDQGNTLAGISMYDQMAAAFGTR